MQRLPEHIAKLHPYVPGKPIEETRREYGITQVIKLASNENPLGPSPKALQAAQKALKETHRYPDSAAFELKAALSNHTGLEPEELVIGNGSNELIRILIQSLCASGDAVLTSEAAFIAYKVCAQVQNIRVVEVPLRQDFSFDLNKWAELLKRDRRVRLVFLPNPNNPTGTYCNRMELNSFLEKVDRLDKPPLVVLDYAYWEYVTARDLPDPLPLFKRFKNVAVLRTFSKIYGLAGFRLGYGIFKKELAPFLERVREPFNVNSIALKAGVAALQDRAFVKRAIEINAEGIEYWQKELKRLGVPFLPSQGNFILVNAFEGLRKPGGEVFRSCLARGVIFRPVSNYGLDRHLRVSVGTPKENKKAIRALESELKGRR